VAKCVFIAAFPCIPADKVLASAKSNHDENLYLTTPGIARQQYEFYPIKQRCKTTSCISFFTQPRRTEQSTAFAGNGAVQQTAARPTSHPSGANNDKTVAVHVLSQIKYTIIATFLLNTPPKNAAGTSKSSYSTGDTISETIFMDDSKRISLFGHGNVCIIARNSVG